MWSNLSAIAEKAKEAAARIDNQINDALNGGEGSGGDDASPAEGAVADGSLDGEATPSGSEGWEKCDDIPSDDSVSDDGGEEEGKVKQPEKKETKTQEMSFVDLKSAAADIPKNDAALLDALARIELLENRVNSLKDELGVAREESQNYHSTNLLLEQQVKELQEEKKSLKEEGDEKEN